MNMKKLNSQGFTLLELMVLVAVIGVVTAIGIPSFQSMTVTNNLVDTGNSLRMSIKLARSKAITEGRDTIICSSTDGSTCSDVDGNWIKGWIVGIDLNNDGSIQEANGELLWAHQMDSKTQLTIVPTDPSLKQRVNYSYTGWLSSGNEIGFDICSGYGETSGFPRREVRASLAGEPVITKNTSFKC